MSIVGIIPSRYASSRLPGKALIDIQGKSMVQRVYEQAQKSKNLSRVLVATDDQRIYDHVNSFGGEALMTSPDHHNGTERGLEALNKLEENFDFVINIQGDEPFIDPRQIDQIAELLVSDTQIATLAKKIDTEKDLFNPSVPKVIINRAGLAIYFSRSIIPYLRNTEQKDWINSFVYLKHIGIYGYRTDILNEIVKLPVSDLEMAESLEQLRWLENGYQIRVGITEIETLGIDTAEDLEKARKYSQK